MAFDSEQVVDELRHLLIGKYRRPPQRRGARKRDEFTTAFACPSTNAEFEALADVGPEWSREDTWVQVRRVLQTPRHNTPGAHAAWYLLYLEDMWMDPAPMKEEEWRQRQAATILGMDWAAEKFRFRDDDRTVKFASDIVDTVLVAVQRALVLAAQSAPARASAAAVGERAGRVRSAWPAGVDVEIERRWEQAAPHYPEHLTTSVLAPLLDPHIWIPEDVPDPDAVPSLPALWRDETVDVSELLRVAGGRAYVVGEPGRGKSTLLHSVALTQMRELQGAASIVVSLAELAEQLPAHTLPLPGLLEMLLDVQAGVTGPLGEEARGRVRELLEFDDSTVICLDGLDEVPGGVLADRVRRAIDTLRAVPGALVVSTRPGPRMQVPPGWELVVLRSVRTGHTLLDLWFADPDDPRKARATQLLESRLGLDIAGSPLLLGLVAYTASFDREFDSLPDLYEQYVALTLERIWKAAGRQEFDDVAIDNLMHTARLLAWRMAYGTADSVQPDEAGWRVGETLSGMLRMVDRADREDVARIVQSEGLFTLGAAAASRLHTSYRWVHRTVQEHLVAMHLMEREGRDPERMADRLLGLLSGPDDWRVVAEHYFAGMPTAGQIALLRRLEAVHDDPRYITGEPEALADRLIPHVRDEQVVIEILVARALRDGWWPARFYTDPDSARTDLREVADGEVPIGVIGADDPKLRHLFDTDYVHELLDRFLRHPKPHYGSLLELCLALETRAPHSGVDRFLGVIEAGTPGLPSKPWPDDIREALDLDRIAAQIAAHPDRGVRWRLVHFFVICLRGKASVYTAPRGPLDPVDVDLVRIVLHSTQGNAERMVMTQLLAVSGEYGDALAYAAAKGVSADTIREVVEHPWGIVGAWEHVLLNGGDAGGTALIRDEPHTPAEVIAVYESGWRADSDRMRQLYRAVGEAMIRPDTVSTDALTELYRRVICDPDKYEFDYTTARVPVETLEKILHRVLSIRGTWDETAETILRQDPARWAGSKGHIPVIAGHVDARSRLTLEQVKGWTEADYDRHWAATSHLFTETTRWAARAGMAGMPLFTDHFMEAPEVRGRTLAALDRDVLSVPGNLHWLDRTMMLFRPGFWRETRSVHLAPLLQ